jgi:hypothetical protein
MDEKVNKLGQAGLKKSAIGMRFSGYAFLRVKIHDERGRLSPRSS